MIDFNLIKVAIQEWIVRSSGYDDSKVVFNDQTSPQPSKPYISMKVGSIVDIGQSDARESIDNSGDSIFTGNREFTLSIQSYGDNALNILSTIKDSLDDEAELQTLRDNGVVFVDQLLFDDITELLETTWEERGQMDLLLRTTSVSSHQVGIIESVYLRSTYKRANGSVISENNLAIQDPNAIAGKLLSVHDSTILIESDKINLL